MAGPPPILELAGAVAPSAGLHAGWQRDDWSKVSAAACDTARALGDALEQQCRTAQGASGVGQALGDPRSAAILEWAFASVGNRDIVLAPMLSASPPVVLGASPLVGQSPTSLPARPTSLPLPRLPGVAPAPTRLAEIARARVVEGPLGDALASLPHTGEPRWLLRETSPKARGRLDLLLWEAGAAALGVPELGPWLWADPFLLDQLVLAPARGNLRERSLAARMLATAADGIPLTGVKAPLLRATLTTLRALSTHPEPIVWISAARATGRLAARVASVLLSVQQQLESKNLTERRRAFTALASMPGADATWLSTRIDELCAADDPWMLAAIGPAVPYLVRERGELWQTLGSRLLDARPGPEVVWSLTQGLVTLARREPVDALNEQLLLASRARALDHHSKANTDAQLWETIRRDTDFLDRVAPDVSCPDVLFDRLVEDAMRVGAVAVSARVSAPARSLVATFEGALESVTGAAAGSVEKGQALASMESCTRAAALGLWLPILAAAGRDGGALTDIGRTSLTRMTELLTSALRDPSKLGFTALRTCLRCLGHVIDAGRGPEIAAVVRALTPLATDAKELKRQRKPVADLLKRMADLAGLPSTTERPLPPVLAAWWALSAEGLTLVIDSTDDDQVTTALKEITTACALGAEAAPAAAFTGAIGEALANLGATGTALARGVADLADALGLAESVLAAETDEREALAMIADAAHRLVELHVDPLAAIAVTPLTDSLPPPFEGAADVAELLAHDGDAQAVVDRHLGPLAPLLRAAIAPLTRRLVEAYAVRRRPQRTTTSLPIPGERRVGPYILLDKIGQGAMGEIWIARKGGRRFVVKLPAITRQVSAAEIEDLKHTLEREAALLEGLHDGKLVTYADYGWEGDLPYLVLNYLIGANLEQYVMVRRLELVELKPIVRDVCLGLRALHERRIVHRDLKPANIFLRLALPVAAQERFAPAHRDSVAVPVVEAVLVDFGIARILDGSQLELGGTLGFLAPEQANERAIETRTDVYALAATIVWSMTGRCFFEEYASSQPMWLLAHAEEDPFENPGVLEAVRHFPPKLVELLRAATARLPADRPDAWTFAQRFLAL